MKNTLVFRVRFGVIFGGGNIMENEMKEVKVVDEQTIQWKIYQGRKIRP